jgi:hypothetical protein
VSRWDRTLRRKAEHICEKILRHLGTNESVIHEPGTVAPHWRKPLRLEEINELAPTPDVRKRKGRP